MKISSNITAMMITASMGKANKNSGKAMERLSSGLRINSAADNPAGLALANKLDKQAKGLNQANRNAMDGISLIQTAEGALDEVHSMINRLKELAVQGLNDTLGESDKEKIQQEINQLTSEIKTIGERTEFNGISLLNNDEKIMFQTGANAFEVLEVNGKDINLKQVTDEFEEFSITDEDEAKEILDKIDKAVETTAVIRGQLGAFQNRLEHTVTNLAVSEENTIASLSRIEDTDMAEEMTNYTQHNVISQAAIAMLSQANQRPQQVLQLLNS